MKLSSKTCTVLASIGVVGSVGLTAYATYRITTKLAQLKASHQPTKKEVVKVVAKEAVAPAILTASTLCAVTGAHVIDVKENAALMASYTALRRSYDKYGASVKRALGIDANKEVSKEYIAMSGTPKRIFPRRKHLSPNSIPTGLDLGLTTTSKPLLMISREQKRTSTSSSVRTRKPLSQTSWTLLTLSPTRPCVISVGASRSCSTRSRTAG